MRGSYKRVNRNYFYGTRSVVLAPLEDCIRNQHKNCAVFGKDGLHVQSRVSYRAFGNNAAEKDQTTTSRVRLQTTPPVRQSPDRIHEILTQWEADIALAKKTKDNKASVSKRKFHRFETELCECLVNNLEVDEGESRQRGGGASSSTSLKASDAVRILALLRSGQGHGQLRSSRLLDAVLTAAVLDLQRTEGAKATKGTVEGKTSTASRLLEELELIQLLSLPKAEDLDVAEKFVPVVEAVIERLGFSDDSKDHKVELAIRKSHCSTKLLLALLQGMHAVRLRNSSLAGKIIAELLVLQRNDTNDTVRLRANLSATQLISIARYAEGLEAKSTRFNADNTSMGCDTKQDTTPVLNLLNTFASLTPAPGPILWLSFLRHYVGWWSSSLEHCKVTTGTGESKSLPAMKADGQGSCALVLGLGVVKMHLMNDAGANSNVAKSANQKSGGQKRSFRKSCLMLLQVLVPHLSVFDLASLKGLHGLLNDLSPGNKKSSQAIYTPTAGSCRVSGPQTDVHKVLTVGLQIPATLEAPIEDTSYLVDILVAHGDNMDSCTQET
ncbi:unnamed protein product [Amoebophrya sp. A25]|nr:unnamed protein product [Amoebophrya sp. A25]|eukprot:GSA25T00006569001.1